MRPRNAFAHWNAHRAGSLAAARYAWDRALAGDAHARSHVEAWLATDGGPPGTRATAPATMDSAARASWSNLAPIADALNVLANAGPGIAPKQIQIARRQDLETISAEPLQMRWRLRVAGNWQGGPIDLDIEQTDAMIAVMRHGRTTPIAPADFIVRGERAGEPCSIHQIRRALARVRREKIAHVA